MTDEPVVMIRTHHPFLHPTKGWRSFARPRKTNRRRKLIPTGECIVPNSFGAHKHARKWTRARHQLRS